MSHSLVQYLLKLIFNFLAYDTTTTRDTNSSTKDLKYNSVKTVCKKYSTRTLIVIHTHPLVPSV